MNSNIEKSFKKKNSLVIDIDDNNVPPLDDDHIRSPDRHQIQAPLMAQTMRNNPSILCLYKESKYVVGEVIRGTYDLID